MELYKAVPTGEPIPDLNLVATCTIPEIDLSDENLYKNREIFFNGQAEFICNLLWKSLPRGTWDKLVAAMVSRHATLLRTAP